MRIRCGGCGAWHFPAVKWWHDRNCAVNKVEAPAVNPVGVKAARGAYPNTDDRREYMRKKMAARRAAAKGGVKKTRAKSPGIPA